MRAVGTQGTASLAAACLFPLVPSADEYRCGPYLPVHIPSFMILLRKIDGVTRSLAAEVRAAD
jgi:hypothetical protein